MPDVNAPTLGSSSHVNRLLVARSLRAFGDGYISLLLPLYLLKLGFSPLEVGILATTTLLGSGLTTLAVGLHAYRFHYRSLLLAATLVMAAMVVSINRLLWRRLYSLAATRFALDA